VQELDSSKRSYSEIIEGLLKYLPSVSSQDVLSDYCVGEILIEDVILKENYPKNFVSRFDGYLCKGIPPFKLVKEVYPGDKLNFSINENTCIFFATGSSIEKNDEGLKFFKMEDVKVENNLIFPISVETKNNWLKPGSEISGGEKLFSKGRKISVKDRFALELLGIRSIKVFKRPKLSIINTGSELINTLDLEKVLPLSSWIISPVAQFDGFEVIQSGPIEDDESLLEEVLIENKKSDIILFIGGTGMGKRDLIRKVLNKKSKPVFERFNTPVGKNSYAYLYEDSLILGFSGVVQASVALYHLILRNLIFKQRGLKLENLVDFCDISEKPGIGRNNWYVSEKIENGKLILKKSNFLNSEFVGFYLDEELFIQKTYFLNQMF
jgi:molybdopterin molybdotransferase